MGTRVQLVMVGPNRGKDITIKGVPFKAGKASVFGPDDQVCNIVKYLETFGAFPSDVADAKQKEVDMYLASKGDDTALRKRKADLLAELSALEGVTAKSEKPVEAPIEAVPAAKEETDGAVENPTPSEERVSESSEGDSSSSRRGKNR